MEGRTSASPSTTPCGSIIGFRILRNEGSLLFSAYDPGVPFLNPWRYEDLDDDRDLDLVAVTETLLSLYRNDGTGQFGAPAELPLVEGEFPVFLEPGDFDADGDVDIAALLSGGTVTILRNVGADVFEGVGTLFTGFVTGLTSGDLDGDGDLDLAASDYLTSTIAVLLNPGDARLEPAAGLSTRGALYTLGMVLAEDLDGDGLADLAALDWGSQAIVWFANASAGPGPDADGNGVIDSCEPRGPSFIRGDCNSDGQVIGVVTDAVFLLNFNFVGGQRPRCLAACDANGDGQVTGVVTDAVYLLTYNFLGGSRPAAPFPACGPGELPRDGTLGCGLEPEACRAR